MHCGMLSGATPMQNGTTRELAQAFELGNTEESDIRYSFKTIFLPRHARFFASSIFMLPHSMSTISSNFDTVY